MSNGNCHACFLPLGKGEKVYHQKCAKEFWGQDPIYSLELGMNEIEELAKEEINQRISVPGVQPKISMSIIHDQSKKARLTVIGVIDGKFILKPPFNEYPGLPEMEALTMQLARHSGILTVPSVLIPMKDEQLAYITRRIDRMPSGEKIPMEDFAQLTGRLTEQKYLGSHEQIAKRILRWAQAPFLDVVKFFEVVLFSFITGNSDMHLKNFSLISPKKDEYVLAPIYDLVPTKVFLPQDKEELALTLNGKKSKVKKEDFVKALETLKVQPKAIDRMFQRVENSMMGWETIISNSFASQEHISQFLAIITERSQRLGLTFTHSGS